MTERRFSQLDVFTSVPLRGNPLAVATAIDKAVDKGYNPQTFINLYTQGANLSGALGQLSGELHSAERRVALQDSRIVRETAFDRLNAGPVSGPGTSSVTSEAGDVSKTVWMRVAGSWGIARKDTIGARYGTDQTAVLVGADYSRDGFKFGGMFSYITTNLDLATFGRSRIESIGGAFYTGYRQDGSGFSVGLGGALASTTARGNRSISVPGLGQTLRSNVSGLSYQIFAEGAYDLAKAENTRVEPFVRIAYTGLDSNAFTETGGNAALSGGKQKNHLT
jgi:outer membrane autotransporter protein